MTARPLALLEIAKRDSAQRKRELGIDTRTRGAEIGSTGLEVFGGVISGDLVEHNQDWMDKERFRTVDLMRKGDSTVAATLMAITLPAIAAEARVVAREGSNGEKPDSLQIEIAHFIHEQLFVDGKMEIPWQQFIREAYLYLAYGHYTFEKIFGEVESGDWAGATGWRKFAPRHPSTIDEWVFDKNGNKLAVIQRVSSEASPHPNEAVSIPIDKMLLFTHQEEAGNPLGTSVFRPAYKHWRYKDGFYAVQAIAIERQGAGVPYAKYPQGSPDPELDKTEEMLQNIQAHEQSYFMFAEDWEVGFTNMGAHTTLDPQRAIEHHDSMIPKAVLAAFMNLPQDSRGSFALSENQTDFFNYTLQSGANYFASVLNRQAIPELVEANWPGVGKYPVVKFDRIGHLSIDRVLTTINESVQQGTLTPDLDLENRVRDLLNLPPIDESEFQEAKDEEQAAAAAAVPGSGVTKEKNDGSNIK